MTHHELGHDEREELYLLRRILEELKEIAGRLKPAKAVSAKLLILDSKGNRLMPAQANIGQTGTAVLKEFTGPNQTGVDIKPIGPVVFSSSDPTIATIDPASGVFTAVAAGTVTLTGLDQGNSLSASDVLSDQPVVAQSAQLVLTVNP